MADPVFLQPDWPAPATVHAAVSTRNGGVSRPPYDSFNLAGHVGDDPAAVAANRSRLQQALALPEQPVWLTQVHGVAVMRLDGHTPVPAAPACDACYSNQPGKVCAVMTADCLPVLFCSRDGREVAAAHAGWRGLVDGVLLTTVQQFACLPADLLVWLGPAIGPASFAVGDDVRDRFLQQWSACGAAAVAACFVPLHPGHWLCDIYALARLQLQQVAGVSAIHGGGEDTCGDSDRFYSFRRDGDTGRMVSLIWRSH